MYTNWKPTGGYGGAERPGVYGRGGGFAQRPPSQYNIPSGGRGNGIPGMGQPSGGVSGYSPGMGQPSPGGPMGGVYGNPGQYQPMPSSPPPNLPPHGRDNRIPGTLNPTTGGPLPPYQAGGVTGYAPGAPGGGRDNRIPGTLNPTTGGPLPPYQGEGVSGFDPNGIGTGVTGNPFTPDPNNITRGGGTMGGSGYYGMPYGWRGLLGG